jgi:hypothetical protein
MCIFKQGSNILQVIANLLFIVLHVLISVFNLFFQCDFWNSQVVPVLDELPNLNNNYAAFLSRTERTVKAPDKVRRLP